MANSGGVIVTIVGQDDTSKVLDQIEERMRRAATPAAQLGRNLGEGMEHAVPQVAAASAAIRLFEGQIPIRAVERLITMVPGLGAALQVAFPVVGGIVFGEMILENVNKLREMRKAALEAGAATSQAFAAMHDKMAVTIDDLQIQSSKLQDEIDKLSGHPNNGVQTALLEAKKAADFLLVSLAEDRKELEALLKEHSVGTLEGIFTGVSATGKQEAELLKDSNALTATVRHANAEYASDLAGANGDAAKIEAAADARNGAVRRAFQSQIDAYMTEAGRLRKEQTDANARAAETAKNGLNPLASLAGRVDNGNKIANVEGIAQQLRDQMTIEGLNETIGGQRKTVGALKGDKENDELAKKAEEAARKQREAADRLADSLRKLQQATADEAARAGKAQADTELAELDAKHKALLLSDADYYRQREQVQEQANARELVAERLKMAALNSQINALQAQNLTGNDATARDAKVNDLVAERLKIAGQIAATEAKTQDGQIKTAEQIAEADQKRIASADAVRARLEAAIGGTAARLQQSRDAYFGDGGRQAQLRARSVDTTEADRLQALDEQRIGAQGAEEDAGREGGVLGEARRNIAYRQKSGAITSQDAKTQGYALDAAQADSLQKVVDAYQKLADGGDLSAVAKVAELNEQIQELRNPIDETAEALRDGFGKAFDGLLENIGEGTKSFEDFGRTVQRIISQQVEKQFIDPGLQAGLAKLIPGRKQTGSLPAGVDLSSVVKPTVPGGIGGGVAGALGVGAGDGKKVSILLNITQNKDGGFDLSSMQKQGDDRDDFEAKLANSFDTGGILKALFGGH